MTALRLENLQSSEENKSLAMTVLTKKLNNYGVNFIYNLLEQQNKHKTIFLYYFKLLAEHKGHSIEFLLDDVINKEDKAINKEMTQEKKKLKYEDILKADEISQTEYEYKLKLQEQQQLNEKGKYQIQKQTIKNKLGFDYANEYEEVLERVKKEQETERYNFNDDIDKQFFNIGKNTEPVEFIVLLNLFENDNKLKNMVNMIDEKNYKQETDDNKDINLDKLIMIKNLLSDLGYKNIYDRETKINNDELLEKMEHIKNNNKIFKEGVIKTYFNSLSSNKKIFDSSKSFLGFVNSLFNNYGFKIVCKQIKRDNKRIYIYYLEFIEYIEEIIHFKLLKGLKMHDTNNIYKYDNCNMKLLHFIDRQTYKDNLYKYQVKKGIITEYEEEEEEEEIKINNGLDYGL